MAGKKPVQKSAAKATGAKAPGKQDREAGSGHHVVQPLSFMIPAVRSQNESGK